MKDTLAPRKVARTRSPRPLRSIPLLETAFSHESLPYLMAWDIAAGTSPLLASGAMERATIAHSIDARAHQGDSDKKIGKTIGIRTGLVTEYLDLKELLNDVLMRVQEQWREEEKAAR